MIRIKFIITPDLLTLLNQNGDEFTTPITPEQYGQLVEAGLPVPSYNLDRIVWAEPTLSFPHVVKYILPRDRTNDFNQWLLHV
jgi:hypothetical protein